MKSDDARTAPEARPRRRPRVRATEDVCKEGDMMWVKCLGVDDRGRVKLSRKEAMRDRAAQGLN